ncbi:MAG: RNA methyltransferase [Candidatus Electrothrix scaldis]|nr:MAG: RNA methyltransferase [Candidatus Electrothrix sp. GW3-3]
MELGLHRTTEIMENAFRLDVALIHYPVVNKKQEIVGSAVTNLDLHDIARAGRTFGLGTYWVVTPYEQQQELAASIAGHWTEGHGGTVNPDRADALSIIQIRASLDQVITEMAEQNGRTPLIVATSASKACKKMGFQAVRKELEKGESVLLLLGTAWGLAPEVIEQADVTLPPIKGRGTYNHLSVRSAASICMDRLCGDREDVG